MRVHGDLLSLGAYLLYNVIMKPEVNYPASQSVSGKRMFIGLSGGVDSAVSAALLQQAGADVVGVFIQGWYPPGQPCTWKEDRRDAMRVAAHLGIPFRTLDASADYKKGVIDYLLAEYAAGRTPNPDVMCNRDVKFGAFYRYAKEHGADYIATGHYAQTAPSDEPDAVRLMRGLDAAKDQSYFLWAIPKNVLAETLFPVGGMPKNEVRAIATMMHLPVAQKKDSQGVCFLGSISVDDFLRQEIGAQVGEAYEVQEDGSNRAVGRHNGAILYTLGERVSLMNAEPGPWFVVAKDLARDILTVSKNPASTTPREAIMLRDENWLADPDSFAELTAQYRYHGPLVAGSYDAGMHSFVLHTPESTLIAPGQSLVLYAGDECVGGGIIG